MELNLGTFFRDSWNIAKFDLWTAIRTKRAVAAIVMYSLGALITAIVLVKIEASVGNELAQLKTVDKSVAAASGATDTQLETTLSTFVGGDIETARQILGMPLVILGFFWMSLTFLPFLILLVSHDIVNVEVRNRSARYVLLRTSRGALLTGKMISHGLLFLGVTIFSNAALFFYAWYYSPGFQPLPSLLLLLRIWILIIPFAFCWMAFTAMISAFVDNGLLALIVAGIGMALLGILSLNDSLAFLAPNHYKLWLWKSGVLWPALGSGVFILFGLIFTAVAWARISWRDM
ncbi:MAG TPA: ABC transporter permease subunit [Myxococcota bacterium]|nr:ABC transporter permease subunit [Myxococcota bacterium]